MKNKMYNKIQIGSWPGHKTKIDRKSAISLQRGQFDPKFQVEGDVFTNNFGMDIKLGQWMPYNFATHSFHTKKRCSRLSSREVQF